MSLKFCASGEGSEQGNTEIFFEFLDHELGDSIKLKYISELVVNKFVGSLQTTQHQGIFLEPITWSGEFFGHYVDANGNYINAKQRADQLLRLKGRVVKWFYEGIKQLVIIKEVEYNYHNYESIEYTITIQPHDIQNEVRPTEVKQFIQNSFIMSQEKIDAKTASDLTGLAPEEVTFERENDDVVITPSIAARMKKLDTNKQSRNFYGGDLATKLHLRNKLNPKKFGEMNRNFLEQKQKALDAEYYKNDKNSFSDVWKDLKAEGNKLKSSPILKQGTERINNLLGLPQERTDGALFTPPES